MLRLGLWLAIVVLAALIATGLALRWLVPSGEEVPPPAWANEYDVTAQQPEAIKPGTEAGDGPPAGWSHLVIKGKPRVKPSEVSKIPTNSFLRGMIVERTKWMFTLFAADVVEERQGAHARFRLRAIGLGLGANVNGKDVVLTVEASEQSGPRLDPIQKLSLKTGYEVQKQSRVVVHGPSFALVDTPVTFRCGDKNRNVRFRYALLVDAPTGRLDVFCWRLGAEGGECADLSRAVLLKPNLIDEAELLADPAEFEDKGFGLRGPTALGFGVDDLPPHRLEVKLPPEASAPAGKTKFAPDDARALEDALRKLLPAG
jgi:hypothetical protein